MRLAHAVTGAPSEVAANALVSITGRLPNDQLVTDLEARNDEWADRKLRSVQCIGDARVPGTIATAVWWGHRFAVELDEDQDHIYFLRERVSIERN